jgi:hypothetical protein
MTTVLLLLIYGAGVFIMGFLSLALTCLGGRSPRPLEFLGMVY